MSSAILSQGKEPKKREWEPYKIGNLKVSFSQLPQLLSSCPPCEMEGGRKTLRIGVVYGSGLSTRYVKGTGQIGLISDALYISEILLQINRLLFSNNPESTLIVDSLLDIDMSDRQRSNLNLILVATGDVNLVTAQLVESYSGRLKVTFGSPISPTIKGLADNYEAPRGADMGALIACANPWSNGRRFAIVVGGINAIGTVAASKLLLDYLHNVGPSNNKMNPNVPSHVVKGRPRKYKVSLRPKDRCIPELEVANLDENNGYEIIE